MNKLLGNMTDEIKDLAFDEMCFILFPEQYLISMRTGNIADDYRLNYSVPLPCFFDVFQSHSVDRILKGLEDNDRDPIASYREMKRTVEDYRSGTLRADPDGKSEDEFTGCTSF